MRLQQGAAARRRAAAAPRCARAAAAAAPSGGQAGARGERRRPDRGAPRLPLRHHDAAAVGRRRVEGGSGGRGAEAGLNAVV